MLLIVLSLSLFLAAGICAAIGVWRVRMLESNDAKGLYLPARLAQGVALSVVLASVVGLLALLTEASA